MPGWDDMMMSPAITSRLDPLHVDVALHPRLSARSLKRGGRLPARAHGQMEEQGIFLSTVEAYPQKNPTCGIQWMNFWPKFGEIKKEQFQANWGDFGRLLCEYCGQPHWQWKIAFLEHTVVMSCLFCNMKWQNKGLLRCLNWALFNDLRTLDSQLKTVGDNGS